MIEPSIRRRGLRVLVGAQVLGGLGQAAGGTAGALLARDVAGTDAAAGLPLALLVAGSALAAIPISGLSRRAGRRPGLATALLTGALGAALCVAAGATESLGLLLAGSLLFGAGNTAVMLARYAAADLSEPARRARTIGMVVFATTFGAVAGPNLLDPMGEVAAGLGLPRLTGLFGLAAVAYVAAASVLLALLRPDPLHVARARAGGVAGASAGGTDPRREPPSSPTAGARGSVPRGSLLRPSSAADRGSVPLVSLLRRSSAADRGSVPRGSLLRPSSAAARGSVPRGSLLRRSSAADRGSVPLVSLVAPAAVRSGLLAIVTANLVMVAVMAMTPVHMRHHDHSLSMVGLVISLHIAGMFAPAPLTGRLADRFGPRAVAVAGSATLLAAGALAAAAGGGIGLLAPALLLLGIGWNACLISGSALLVSAVAAVQRPRVEGVGELSMGVAAGAGGALAGPMVAATSYPALAVVAAALAATLAPVLLLAARPAAARAA